jgi:hypothetical protein
MDPRNLQWLGARGWKLAWRQHWAISRTQLLELGLGAEAIRHRLLTAGFIDGAGEASMPSPVPT